MSDDAATRIKRRISNSELERRWTAVRSAMRQSKLDFLVMQNSSDFLGGYVKWFTDIPAINNYPASVVFPRDDEMITVWHGARLPAEPSPPSWALHGVKKRISVPVLPSLHFTDTFDVEKIVEELRQYKNCRIGLVGLGLMAASFYKYLVEHLPGVEFSDATDLVDTIKVIKSDEEIQALREVCELHDAAFKYTLTRIQPGRREYELVADIKHKCLELGGEQSNVLVGSAPPGTPAHHAVLHFNNKVIHEGDQVNILIESNGPSGFYGELGRIICLGKVTDELREQFEIAKLAQQHTVALLKPDAKPAAIWNAHNEFLRSKGYPEEKRVFAHGQGYDMVERPSINPEETMRIQARMFLAVHPGVASSKALATITDNYLISETGKVEWLYKTPQQIFTM